MSYYYNNDAFIASVMSDNSLEQPFKFSSTAGWALCRKILHDTLPFGPHDYQLEGVAAVLDGKDFLGISATGSGKTAFIYMLMHIVLAISRTPSLCPSVKLPMNAAILVIYPTTALEEDQVSLSYYATIIVVGSINYLKSERRARCNSLV